MNVFPRPYLLRRVVLAGKHCVRRMKNEMERVTNLFLVSLAACMNLPYLEGREIIEKRKKDHLLSTFSILGALVCMLTYFL